MPVWKYRKIEDVPSPPVPKTPADRLRSAIELSATTLRIAGTRAPRGVRRYRSIDEASADTPEIYNDQRVASFLEEDRIQDEV